MSTQASQRLSLLERRENIGQAALAGRVDGLDDQRMGGGIVVAGAGFKEGFLQADTRFRSKWDRQGKESLESQNLGNVRDENPGPLTCCAKHPSS